MSYAYLFKYIIIGDTGAQLLDCRWVDVDVGIDVDSSWSDFLDVTVIRLAFFVVLSLSSHRAVHVKDENTTLQLQHPNPGCFQAVEFNRLIQYPNHPTVILHHSHCENDCGCSNRSFYVIWILPSRRTRLRPSPFMPFVSRLWVEEISRYWSPHNSKTFKWHSGVGWHERDRFICPFCCLILIEGMHLASLDMTWYCLNTSYCLNTIGSASCILCSLHRTICHPRVPFACITEYNPKTQNISRPHFPTNTHIRSWKIMPPPTIHR
jgi:hypothetical protein